MRWTHWVFAVAVLGLTNIAAGYQPGCTSCNGAPRASYGFDAEACASPCGHCLVPGCCEGHRRCCDNAWAGYCDHRAKVEDFWSRVGTPKMYARSRPCRNALMGECAQCESNAVPSLQPTPAVPAPSPSPMPTPAAPAKPGRTVYNFPR
jgi:hypothetical protein